MAKIKVKTYVFTKMANCATIGISAQPGTELKIRDDKEIELYGILKPGIPPEIPLYIRSGVLVRKNSQEAQKANVVREGLNARAMRSNTNPSVVDGEEYIRGLSVSREDVVETMTLISDIRPEAASQSRAANLTRPADTGVQNVREVRGMPLISEDETVVRRIEPVIKEVGPPSQKKN